MKSRYLLILVLLIQSLPGTIYSQNENRSKWSVSASFIPHLTGDIYPQTGIGIPFNPVFYNYYLKPAMQIKVGYLLLNRLSLEAGIGYNIFTTDIIQINRYQFSDMLYSGIPDENIHMLELPGSVRYDILNKKHYEVYVSVGDVSSFEIAETNTDRSFSVKGIQTTIYQNYLQFALGFEFKTKTQLSFYASPLYRMAMVNYHDSQHYDIYAYPNVFYERMLGLELGAKYHFLKIE